MRKKAWMLYALALTSQDFNGLINQAETAQKTAHKATVATYKENDTISAYNKGWDKLRLRARNETVGVKVVKK